MRLSWQRVIISIYEADLPGVVGSYAPPVASLLPEAVLPLCLTRMILLFHTDLTDENRLIYSADAAVFASCAPVRNLLDNLIG